MIVSNTVFFQEKNASPENENGWTPSKKKKDGISRNPSWVHLRKSQVKGRPPIVFQVPKSASPAVKFSGMETFLGSEVYSLGKLGYAPAGGLLESIGDYVWKLKTNQIMGGCGDLLGWFFGGCGWFWCFFCGKSQDFRLSLSENKSVRCRWSWPPFPFLLLLLSGLLQAKTFFAFHCAWIHKKDQWLCNYLPVTDWWGLQNFLGTWMKQGERFSPMEPDRFSGEKSMNFQLEVIDRVEDFDAVQFTKLVWSLERMDILKFKKQRRQLEIQFDFTLWLQ